MVLADMFDQVVLSPLDPVARGITLTSQNRKNTRRQRTIRLDADLSRALDLYRGEHDGSIADIVCAALQAYKPLRPYIVRAKRLAAKPSSGRPN